jgi:hypothetical protein
MRTRPWRPLTAHILLTFAAVTGNVEELLYDKPDVHPTLLQMVRLASPLTFATTAIGTAILFFLSIRHPAKTMQTLKPAEDRKSRTQIQA